MSDAVNSRVVTLAGSYLQFLRRDTWFRLTHLSMHTTSLLSVPFRDGGSHDMKLAQSSRMIHPRPLADLSNNLLYGCQARHIMLTMNTYYAAFLPSIHLHLFVCRRRRRTFHCSRPVKG
jgi:hypothetical protein